MARGARKRVTVGVAALSALLSPLGAELPTEFRIFAAGWNTTSKGRYLFDEQAARAVMAGYEAHGADVMIDLEHLSIEDSERSVNFDPDARGWCKLELRTGELWATNVAWTPDGEVRLREKRQRYSSPVFGYDTATRRITEILNIAITALPATDNLEPLVAAARRQKLNIIGEGEPMNQEQFAAIAEALGLGADAAVEDVLATIAAMVKKIQDAANGTSAEPPVEAKEPPPEEMAPPMAAASKLAAASRVLVRLSGKKEIGEVVSEVETWRTSHLELEAERAKMAKERGTLEASERRKLVGELVKLGAEIPATAWENADGKTPAKRFMDESLESLRDRVTKLSKVRGVLGGSKDPPARGAAGNVDAPELTPEQLKICADQGCKPEEFAALRKIYPAPVAR